MYDIVSLLQAFSIVTAIGLSPSSRVMFEQLIIPLFGSNVNGVDPPLSVAVIFEIAGTFTVAILII